MALSCNDCRRGKCQYYLELLAQRQGMAVAGWQHMLVRLFLSYLAFLLVPPDLGLRSTVLSVQAAALQGREVRLT